MKFSTPFLFTIFPMFSLGEETNVVDDTVRRKLQSVVGWQTPQGPRFVTLDTESALPFYHLPVDCTPVDVMVTGHVTYPNGFTVETMSINIDGGADDDLSFTVDSTARTASFDCPFQIGKPAANHLICTSLTGTTMGGATKSVTDCIQVPVQDDTAPTLSCPIATDVPTNADNCIAEPFSGTATVVEHCDDVDDVTFESSSEPSGTYTKGSHSIVMEAMDTSMNLGSCTWDVQVVDQTPPVITTCPGSVDPLLVDDQCQVNLPSYVDHVVATDNCNDITKVQTPGVGDPVSVGDVSVSVEVTDSSGNTNTDTCSWTVDVEDHTSPVISCPSDVTIDMDAFCDRSLPGDQPVATDNCDNDVAISSDYVSPLSFGENVVTFTAEDDSGNTATCAWSVTLMDPIPPQLSNCPADQTIDLTQNGLYSLPDHVADITESDNCGIDSVQQDPPPATWLSPGDSTIVVTATDLVGNTATCSWTVTVVDSAPPMITCPDDLTIRGTQDCDFVLPDYSATASDNVNVSHIVRSMQTGDALSYGPNVVTFTAHDVHGNTATCDWTVFVNTYVRTRVDILGFDFGDSHKTRAMAEDLAADYADSLGYDYGCALVPITDEDRFYDVQYAVNKLHSEGDVDANGAGIFGCWTGPYRMTGNTAVFGVDEFKNWENPRHTPDMDPNPSFWDHPRPGITDTSLSGGGHDFAGTVIHNTTVDPTDSGHWHLIDVFTFVRFRCGIYQCIKTDNGSCPADR